MARNTPMDEVIRCTEKLKEINQNKRNWDGPNYFKYASKCKYCGQQSIYTISLDMLCDRAFLSMLDAGCQCYEKRVNNFLVKINN